MPPRNASGSGRWQDALAKSPCRIRSIILVLLTSSRLAAADPPTPDFRFEIRPVLSRNCFPCHGPDDSHREADLRLDDPDAALASGVFVPGQPDESELFRRISSEDDAERMPPPESGHELQPGEIDALRRWIAGGAKYARHWSYEPPRRPALPAVSHPEWCRNTIDYFVLAQLERAGLQPAPEADRRHLMRRVSLDVIGLPPTPEEVERFVSDHRPDAYERLVDRLLAAPAYGEHWAVKWLDLARYADTCGYEQDKRRSIWSYRDWVINALNADMPFDQFTIEQLAGDLLPNPTREQMIATAFHRNTMQNDEGGTDDEEFRVAAVVDRVNTTMQVWMGTTMGCCRCHSHKFDPLTQREYYELYAFFNQTADADRDDQEPTLLTPTEQQQRQQAELDEQLAECHKKLAALAAASAADQRKWEDDVAADVEWQPIEIQDAESSSGAACRIQEDGSVLVNGGESDGNICTFHCRTNLRSIAALRIEIAAEHANPQQDFILSRIRVIPESPVRPAEGVKYVRVELPDRHDYLALAEVQVFRGRENLALKGIARQSSTAYEGPPQLAIDGRTDGHFATGRSVTHTAFELNPWWEVELTEAAQVDRIVVWNRDEFSERLGDSRVTLLDTDHQPVWRQTIPFAPNLSATLITSGHSAPAITRAGADSEVEGHSARRAIEFHDAAKQGWSPEPQAPGPHWLVLGFEEPLVSDAPLELTVLFDQQTLTADNLKASFRRFRLVASDDPRAPDAATVPPSIRQAAMTPVAKRTAAQKDELSAYFRANSSRFQRIVKRCADLERRAAQGLQLDKTPIMRELSLAEQRTTRIQVRGNFLDLGAEVSPDTPQVFPPFPADAPRNRLELARWLVDRNNPLTARVAANRQWEQLFGAGIVATSEDFGSQGTLPSHPELLDWLAIELMDGGWSLKHLTKTIVMSATYRQSSRTTAEKLAKDPQNQLISRGLRGRLTAEQLRDQALFVSGLLSGKMFGPSVMPTQPDGVWQVVYSDDVWKRSEGDDRYRRGLYTFWRRTSPYPSATAFDATSRETCTIRRTCTNTPVAAFVLLNDPVYVEAAQALARRIANHCSGDTAKGVDFAFHQVLLRPPATTEVERLTTLYESLREHYRADQNAARQMATSELGPADGSTSFADLAAWTVVSNVLLNLDETVTK